VHPTTETYPRDVQARMNRRTAPGTVRGKSEEPCAGSSQLSPSLGAGAEGELLGHAGMVVLSGFQVNNQRGPLGKGFHATTPPQKGVDGGRCRGPKLPVGVRREPRGTPAPR